MPGRRRRNSLCKAAEVREGLAWLELAGESGGWRAGVTGGLGAAGVGPLMPAKKLDLYPAGGEGDPWFPRVAANK